jgi:hypothetical protein
MRHPDSPRPPTDIHFPTQATHKKKPTQTDKITAPSNKNSYVSSNPSGKNEIAQNTTTTNNATKQTMSTFDMHYLQKHMIQLKSMYRIRMD